MKLFLKILFCLSLLCLLSINSQAGEWRGIVPLNSTCQDVENKLKIKACSHSEVKYVTESEEVSIYISSERNEKMFQRRCDVPIGTVLQVIVDYKKYPSINDFKEDLSKYKQSISDIETFYHSEEKGLEFSVIGHNLFGNKTTLVSSIWFSPTQKDIKSRCQVEK